MWVQLLRLPYNILFPLILLFTIVGVYASSNNIFDVYVMIAFGLFGYLTRKLGYEAAPMVLAFVLGSMLENNLRKALILSQGELMTFLERPISRYCLIAAVILLLLPLVPFFRKKREAVALEDGNI
jgi:putative tricarboxylic transport membrane protein